MRVCQSRKSMHSVMNNTGYGLMTITRNGITVEVPPSYFKKDGNLKKYALEIIEREFSKKAQLRGVS